MRNKVKELEIEYKNCDWTEEQKWEEFLDPNKVLYELSKLFFIDLHATHQIYIYTTHYILFHI